MPPELQAMLDQLIASGMSPQDAWAFLAQGGLLSPDQYDSSMYTINEPYGDDVYQTYGDPDLGLSSGFVHPRNLPAPYATSGLQAASGDIGSGMNTGISPIRGTQPRFPLSTGMPAPNPVDDPAAVWADANLWQDNAEQVAQDWNTKPVGSDGEIMGMITYLINTGMTVDDALSTVMTLSSNPVTLRENMRGSPTLDYVLASLGSQPTKVRPPLDVPITGPTHLAPPDLVPVGSVNPPSMLETSDFNNPGIGFGDTPTPLRGAYRWPTQGEAMSHPQQPGFLLANQDLGTKAGWLPSGGPVNSVAGTAFTGDPSIFGQYVPYMHPSQDDPRYEMGF